MSVLISGLQNRVKNAAAYAPEFGLMLISNGEELPYLLTPNGEKIPAGFAAPTNIPTIADAGSGNLTNGDYVIYQVVYVAENAFPLVAAVIYSNPGPVSATYNITGSGNRQLTVSFQGATDPNITSCQLYRIALQTTAALAVTSAGAGLLNYVGTIANATGTLSITDNTLSVIGNLPIALINYTVPQFAFCVWDGSFFWGFGNLPFTAQATWDLTGAITLSNPSTDQFYGGRNGQFITFNGVTTGGIDQRGTYLFQQTGSFTGQTTLADGSNATLPTATGGNIVITGQTANLYRSGYRNPFQWGYLQNVGGIYVPNIWQLRVSGSLGTAIAIIPDQQLLKLDMEFPALCVTYTLQSASTDVFQGTQRQVSRLYSVTSHFSQFFALSQGRQVLWGMDYKNLAIVQCDGYTQVPISGPISILLRQLTKNRSLQLQCHGTYDPVTEINAMWLSTSNVDANLAPFNFDICVYQHAPTGFWGVIADQGILCSAPIEDPISSERNTLVGTQNGFLGKAFDVTTNGNFLPGNSIWEGFISSASATTITRADGQDDFSPVDAGLIGNYCLIVDENGLNPQIVEIIGATNNTLTFGQTLNPIPSSTSDIGLAGSFMNGIFVSSQWKFFIGLIELRMLKYMDGGEPSVDKSPREFWVTLEDAKNPHVEYFPEHTQTAMISAALKHDKDSQSSNTMDAWFTKSGFPGARRKTFGLAVVERSFNPTIMYNFTLK